MRHETAVSRTFVESLRFGSLAREKLLLLPCLRSFLVRHFLFFGLRVCEIYSRPA
jgi:hypothetical protein